MTASTRADRVTGLVLIVLGLAVGAQALTFDVLFLTDPVGPKALPLLSATVFVLSGILLLLRPGSTGRWPERPVLLRMAGAVLAFLVYAALLAPLGFVVATTLTVTALSLLFDGPWLKSVGAATALSAVLWYLFVWALDLQLPLGRVWEVLWRG